MDDDNRWLRSVDELPETGPEHVEAAEHLLTFDNSVIPDDVANSDLVQDLTRFGLLELRKATDGYEYRRIFVKIAGSTTWSEPL
jgi:hypothetical protein